MHFKSVGKMKAISISALYLFPMFYWDILNQIGIHNDVSVKIFSKSLIFHIFMLIVCILNPRIYTVLVIAVALSTLSSVFFMQINLVYAFLHLILSIVSIYLLIKLKPENE